MLGWFPLVGELCTFLIRTQAHPSSQMKLLCMAYFLLAVLAISIVVSSYTWAHRLIGAPSPASASKEGKQPWQAICTVRSSNPYLVAE